MGVGIGGSPTGANTANFWNWAGGMMPSYGGSTDIGKTILENSIPTNFFQYKHGLGVADDDSAFSRWFNQQLGNYTLGYNAYTAAQPLTANLGSYDASLGGFDAWKQKFLQSDPSLRGLDQSSRGAGPVRWLRS